MRINAALIPVFLFFLLAPPLSAQGEGAPVIILQPIESIDGNLSKRCLRVGVTSIQSFFISFLGADDLKAKDLMTGLTAALANYPARDLSMSFTMFLNSKVRFFYADLGSAFWWGDLSNMFKEFTFSGFNVSLQYSIPVMKSIRPFVGIDAMGFFLTGTPTSKLIVDDMVFPTCGIEAYLADEFTIHAKLLAFHSRIKKATYKGELDILTYPAEFNYNSINIDILYNIRF
jgi:hypothetical protein